MARTLEELEALHTQRAINKGLMPAASAAPAGDDDEHDQDEEGDNFEEDDNFTEVDQQSDRQEDSAHFEEEIARLQQQLSAAQGRVTPAQQQAEEHRRLYETERQARAREKQEMEDQIQALQEQIEANEAQIPVEEFLSPEEREMFDPAQLSAITKIADTIAKRRAPRVDVKAAALAALTEREQLRVEEYRREVLTDPTRGLTTLGLLAHDPNFQAWLDLEENEGFDPLVNSLLQARSEKEIDRYSKAIARRVAKFKELGKSAKTPAASRTTDAKTSLTTAMQRRPRQVGKAEIESQLAEAKRLARSRNPKDRERAQAILNKLN